MADPFASPKRRLSRANEHIKDIKSRLEAFINSKPYAQVIETDAKGWDEYKLKMVREIPDVVTDLAYEAVEALRSALDQAAYPIAVACNSKRPDLVHFPVADTDADFENVLKGRIKDFPADILALFRGFKPYKAGNVLVWALNRIRRQGTHRFLIPVATRLAGIDRINMSSSAPVPVEIPPLRWNTEKNEIVFLRTIGKGANPKYDLQLSLFIAFGDVEGLAGEPVAETLEAIAGEVARIVGAIEAEANRINLFG